MNSLYRLAVTLALVATLNACAVSSFPDAHDLRVMTFNIRYDNPNDGENSWPYRREQVVSLVRFFAPDVLGVQESLAHQHAYMKAALPGYAAIGVARQDGSVRGEFVPIFINQDRFSVGESGTFWLSETPDVPSVGWDAALPRIVTWVRVSDQRSRKRYLLVNTHWDHRGKTAQIESGKMLRDWLLTNLHTDEMPVVVGDLNVHPLSEAYSSIVDGSVLVDSALLGTAARMGPPGTFTGFDPRNPQEEPIDYVLVAPGTEVLRHGVITQHSDGRLPSDHYPVIADIRLH